MTTTKEPDLFEREEEDSHALARRTDPGTSHEAAAHMDETGTTTKIEGEVYDCFDDDSRLTSLEICDATGRPAWSISPRFAPLERKGFIRRDGKKAVINSSGNLRKLQAWVKVKKDAKE